MTKLERLSQQEQDFIYEISRKFITGKTMDKIADEIGISRRTAFNWKEKFKELIEEQKVAEFSTIEDKVLKTANDLLDSSKLSDRLKGSELFFDTMKILQARRDMKAIKRPELSTEDVLKELGL
ncbi:helix-turn-helix domain-containing protein [Clostridium sp. NSJ-145]|uniref:helix-turn-helix domain-containing protein n=1 Tax=Clostridium sp. NSJ-145 TaxID=2897777 RepID=UPI001E601798|nr:helix-turn-helix domain-containing protein [Clostridium sp. NSJ-145]MCD2500187.1 helix-turn-helix domain-containing protein [Clostridium sp. NSJ-145]